MPLRNFKKKTERLDLHILSQLPWGSDCQKANPWEFHTHIQPREVTFHPDSTRRKWPKGVWNQAKHLSQAKFHLESSDPVSEEILSSFYYTIIFVFLCGSQQRKIHGEFARENMEVTIEDCWPHFSTQVVTRRERWDHREEKANHICPDFHRRENILKTRELIYTC